MRLPKITAMAMVMLAASWAFLGTPRSASAASIGAGASFQLDIATDGDLLLKPDDPMAQMMAVWKTAFEIKVLRSMPVFQLTNTSTDSVDILGFTIDMNEPGYSFDKVEILSGPNGFAPSLTSPTDAIMDGDIDPVLKWDFSSSHLAPGESFLFRARIVPNGEEKLTDFRNILWNQYSSNRDDNALVSVEFEGCTTDPTALYEYPFSAAAFDTVPLDGADGSARRLPGMHLATDVGMYQFAQGVPEPGSCVLLLSGLFLTSMTRTGRRRN